MDEIIKEIEFYDQKLKEAKVKLYGKLREQNQESIEIIGQEVTDQYAIYHGDCVEVLRGIPDDSIHYSIFSPPFSSLFTYSASIRDMGNSKDNQFYDHFMYAVKDLYRIMMPGRLLSFHCMDLPMTINSDGIIGMKDFPGIILRIFQETGFIYHSKVCIWKNPLVQATRTKNLTLAHKQVVKDSTRCAQGMADYIITIRKPGVNPEPVSRGRGFEEYIGDDLAPRTIKNDNPKLNKYSHHVWQRYASPVWMDINQTDTLNVQMARDERDERHICPLQLGVISRCLELWSNKGDTILSPFAGIGSEGYKALQMGRKFIGVELKRSYYLEMKRNLQKAIGQKGFDLR